MTVETRFMDPVTQFHSHDGGEEHTHHQRYPNHRITVNEDTTINTTKNQDGGITLTFLDHKEHTVCIRMEPSVMTTLATQARNLGLAPRVEKDVEIIPQEEWITKPFTDPEDQDSCRLLLTLNEYSTVWIFAAYGPSDMVVKEIEALWTAKDARTIVPQCTCGQCYAITRNTWEMLFGDEPRPHYSDQNRCRKG